MRMLCVALALILLSTAIAARANAASKASPTIATTSSLSSGAVGGSVYETATLNGGNSPTGRAVYYYYENGDCSGVGDQIGNVTVTGNGDALPSYSVTFSSPGSYSFQAAYTGDANNNPATSTCAVLSVVEASSTTPSSSTSSSTAVASSSSSSSGSLWLDLGLVIVAAVLVLALAAVMRRGRGNRTRGSAVP